MNQINYLSDIKLLENYPKTDNFIYHFTTDGETCYNVSLEDGNCRKDGDYLVICLDNHGLPEGQLRVRREFHFPDDDFPDKDWTKIVEHSYDIYLAEGVDIEADQYVLPTYMPIFKGDKGDDYVITEADYEAIADIAATKVDCYTTAEVDEKLAEKQDKIAGFFQDGTVTEIKPNDNTENHGMLIAATMGAALEYHDEGETKHSLRVFPNGAFYDGKEIAVKEDLDAKQDALKKYDESGDQVKIGEQFSYMQISPSQFYLQHGDGTEPHYGNISITDNAITLSKEGVKDSEDVNVVIANGKMQINGKDVITDFNKIYATAPTATYKQFENGFVNYGWVRCTKTIGPGVPTYDGLGLTIITKEAGTVKTLKQFFVYADSNDIKMRNGTLDGDSSSYVVSFTDWVVINKNYTSGNGITISSNGSISLTQKFKTINGESIEGDGNIEGGKVDDVKVDGVSVVTDKIANISLTGYQKNQYKANSITDSNKTSNTYYPTTKAVADYVDPVKAKVDDLELYKTPNLTIFGDPTNNEGQLSGFSATNYAQFPFLVDLKDSNFVLDMCITTGDNLSGQQNIFDSEFGLAFAIRNGHCVLALSSAGLSWDLGEYVSDNILARNRTYYLKLHRVDDLIYLESTQDKEYWVTELTIQTDNVICPKQIIIGKSLDSSNSFGGIINLNYCDLSIAGRQVWQGMDDVGLATRLATDLSNIDAAGEAKIKELAGDSGVTEERVQELINATIGDMDAVLDIMLGTSNIDGQLNRIIG